MATIVDETKIKIQAGLRNNDEYENIRKQIKKRLRHLTLIGKAQLGKSYP